MYIKRICFQLQNEYRCFCWFHLGNEYLNINLLLEYLSYYQTKM